ncbi:ABC transporter substrate-binding protein [Solicola sp. PLA-1-18]|uniref:ABC transporter substrate-binding protein n=1 Tax=Solicola sp. PLA-1-18 TaxID=3380532 RepID=UPI003B7A499F
MPSRPFAPRGKVFTRQLRGSAFDRRQLFRGSAALLGAAALGPLLASCGDGSPAAAGGRLPINIGAANPGTAGSVIDPIIEKFGLDAEHGLELGRSAGGGPGAGQDQLLTGVLDSFAFGPLGAVQANTTGHDIVIAGPQLWNHGRWIVPADSDATSIADLRGKRVGVQPAASDTYRLAALAAGVNGIDFAKEFKLFPGQPIANLALYERGDLDAIIAIEPNATRLVADGSRQIATVSAQWQRGTGDTAPLFLNGAAFRRDWLAESDEHARAAKALVALRTEANQKIVDDPSLLATYHQAFGVPATEKKAIELLPERLADIYPTVWDDEVFANLDKQIEVALELKILEKKPSRPVYETFA